MLSYALVDPFVAAADQDHPFQCREFLGHALVEAPPLRRQQHHTLLRANRKALSTVLDVQSFNTFKDRFRLQHHAFAASEGAVIHGAVPVVRKSPQIVDFDRCQTRFPGPANNAIIQRPAKKVRKDR